MVTRHEGLCRNCPPVIFWLSVSQGASLGDFSLALSCPINTVTLWGFSHHLFMIWLDFSLPSRCPQVVWLRWGEIEPFSATLAQDGLAECDPLKYSAVAGNWTWATGRADSELFHWAIMTRATGTTDSELFHWAIMTQATWRTDSELSHWAIMVRATWRTDNELFHWAIKTRCAIHSVIASPYHGKCGMTYTLLECRGKCIENEEMLIGVDLRNLVDCMRARDPLGHWYTYNIQRSIYITLCWDNITLW